MKLNLSLIGCIIVLLTFTFLLLPSSVSAHLIGQPPFLKINGQYANLYPVPLTSLYNFDLPQDLAPQNYQLNQPVNFELDKDRLPAPTDIIQKTKFDWDFIDGTHAQGLKNIHTFSQIGSYIIKIYADDGITPKPQILESILVNILPNDNYQLPQAKILINGKMSKDPLTDIINADFKDPIQLDAKLSTSANSLEYFWDFGDQKSAFGATQTHTYPKDLSQVFIVLRVKDNNGFLADSFVEIQNTQNSNQNYPSPSTKTNQPKKPVFNIIFIIIIIVILTLAMARWWLLARHHGKHQ